MDWTDSAIAFALQIGARWWETTQWLIGLGLVFGLLARLMPCNPGGSWWKNLRSVRTDLGYWLVAPICNTFFRQLMFIVAVGLLFSGREPDVLPVKYWPAWLQCVAILLIQDVILYVIHSFFHTPLAWKFHAVHHSPETLDWTSAARFHPVNNILEFALADLIVVLLGFPWQAVLLLMPINTIYSAMVHANLNWTFGPFRYLLASPVFHRWHHTTERDGRDKNFASTFPVLDLICGTYYMPEGRVPEVYGTGEGDVPVGFLGQLVYPFRRPEAVAWARRRPGLATLAVGLSALLVVGGGSMILSAAAARHPDLREPDLTQNITDEDIHILRVIPPPAPGAEPAGNAARPAVTCVATTADGHRSAHATEDGKLKVWDMTSSAPTPLIGHTRAATSVALTADGSRVVSGGRDRTVRIWSGDSGVELRTLFGHNAPVLSVAVTPDGRVVASGSADGTVRVWDAMGDACRVFTGAGGAISGVAISADGRHVVAASLTTATVWDVADGHERILSGHTDLVYGVAISGDGTHIATASFDGTAKVWNTATGREEATCRGHEGPVYAVAIGSARLVSGGADRTARVWDLATGGELFTLPDHDDTVTSVAITADGEQVLSGSRDGLVKVRKRGTLRRP